MTRPLDTATAAAFQQTDLPLAVIFYLDILGDATFAWTGLGDLVFGATETGDPGLDGMTFTGTGTAIQVGQIADKVGGSDVLELTLPGVDLTMPELRQLVYVRNRWQFRRAIVWFAVLDPNTYAIVGKPFRVKTGRIDQMPYSENGSSGMVKCRIEGQQSYGQQPSLTRYTEQNDISPSDVSQNYVYSLANMTAAIGGSNSAPSSLSGGVTYGSDSKAMQMAREYMDFQ
jgi:hypothetical protein